MPLQRRLPSLLAVALLAAATLFAGVAPVSAGASRESRLLARINASRAAHGLAPVRTSPDLMAAARRHSRAMAGSRLLFHTVPLTSLCCWSVITENVGSGRSVRGVHRAFMHSPLHRSHVLDGRVSQVGIGTVWSGGRLWVTEEYRRPQ